MTYRVVITDHAARDLREVADWIAQRAPLAAERWFNRFCDAIQSLQENPARCSLARESHRFPYELRQLLYGRKRSYRAVFTVQGDSVVILTIRHAARQDLSPDDV